MFGENKIAWHLPDPDLRWKENCHEIYMKAMSKMWLLRRLKRIDFDIDLILDFYLKEIRPFTEHGVVVWNSGLTKGQVAVLEKVQKVALKIILKTTTYLMTWPVR